jgi:hypothetical protein
LFIFDQIIKMNALSYECHRQFLFEYLSKRELTLRDFVESIDHKTSISALSHFFKRDKQGEWLGGYSFRLDTWIDILTRLELTNSEFDYLINLKLEADINAIYGPDSKASAHFTHVKKLLRNSGSKKASLLKTATKKALLLAALYDLLPKKFKLDLINEAIRFAEYSLAGQKRTSKLSKIGDLIKQLEE